MNQTLRLAGDVGGTTTRLGLFEPAAERPHPVFLRTYRTLDVPDAQTLLAAFLRDARVGPDAIAGVCLGVAGPIVNGRARLTNVPWEIDAAQFGELLGRTRVVLVNDLHATAAALPVLQPGELHTLQAGAADPHGPLAVIAAGTGLGEATLHRVDGRWVPLPTEAGHADFAPRTDDDVRLWRLLRARFGRASVEHVVSGPGLGHLHTLTHEHACRAFDPAQVADVAAAVSAAARDNRCDGCRRALDLFVEAYGAEAGNLALRALPTGGLFVAGGIAPKILPALSDERFMHAFLDKAPMTSLLERMPVQVVLHPNVGLLGAAVCELER